MRTSTSAHANLAGKENLQALGREGLGFPIHRAQLTHTFWALPVGGKSSFNQTMIPRTTFNQGPQDTDALPNGKDQDAGACWRMYAPLGAHKCAKHTLARMHTCIPPSSCAPYYFSMLQL
eukprot:311159-Pelagomonas_calceolata.AAC.5